jgi:hypothetical protein
MKIPGPMIAVLLIIVILFCCASGLGLQGSLNLFSYDSAQDLMGGDLFDFMRPRVGVDDVPARPDCLEITETGEDRQLSKITLSSAGSCEFSIIASSDDVRTLPLRFISGQPQVSYVPATPPPAPPSTPAPTSDPKEVRIENRAVNSTRKDLNISVSRGGGTVSVTCISACQLGIEN